MRPRVLRLSLALCLLSPVVAYAAPEQDDEEAHPARLLHYAVLRSGPRETFPVVARVAKGVRVSVVRTRAAWSKVTTKSRGASGWVPRDLLGDTTPVAPERRGARPLTIEPDEVAPVTRSRFAGVPLEGRRFEVPAHQPAVARVAMMDPTPAPLAPAAMVEQAAAPVAEVAAAPRRAALPWLELGVGGGVEASEHSLRSTSRVPLGSYVSTQTAAAVDVRGLARHRPRGPWELAAQVRYRLASAPAGVRMRVPGGPIEELAVAHEQTDFSLEAGWRARRTGGAGVLARGGYHFESTQIDRGNIVALPSEHLEGPIAGATLDVPEALPSVDLRLDFDALVRASRNQTPGLREGLRAPTLGLFGAARVRYRASTSFAVDLGYGFSQTRTELAGAGARLPDVQAAQRATTTHLVTLGTTYLIE